MSAARLAVASLPVVDLRRLPDHRAELVSQLLLGEAVEVRDRSGRGEWLRVRSREDGYSGWARAWGVEERGAEAWLARATHRLEALWAVAEAAPGGGPSVSSLVWRSRLALAARRGDRARVELPDGRMGWVAAAALKPARARTGSVTRVARRLLGIPYLWGGRTAQGFDCSGLVQQVLAATGVSLPRDAHDQWKACRPLARSARPRVGDLLFFGRPGRRMTHVGLALEGGYFLHAMGQVRLAHFDPCNPLYDSALMGLFRGIGRPARGAGPGGRAPRNRLTTGPARSYPAAGVMPGPDRNRSVLGFGAPSQGRDGAFRLPCEFVRRRRRKGVGPRRETAL